MGAGRLFSKIEKRSGRMSDNDDNDKQKPQPKKITREEADRLNNFAQGLDDEITHVVDYGEGLGEEENNG